MGLFAPDWKSKDKNKALKAVESMTDQAELFRVILENSLEEAQLAAVDKLTNLLYLRAVPQVGSLYYKKAITVNGSLFKLKKDGCNVTLAAKLSALRRLNSADLIDLSKAWSIESEIALEAVRLLIARQNAGLLDDLLQAIEGRWERRTAVQEAKEAYYKLTGREWQRKTPAAPPQTPSPGGTCDHVWEHNVRVRFGPGYMYGKRCKKCGKTERYEIHV